MSKVYYITECIFTEDKIRNEKSPIKAIKNYCKYSCCCNDQESWKNCTNEDCFLWKFRLGKSGRVKNYSEEYRNTLRERMRELGKMRKQ